MEFFNKLVDLFVNGHYAVGTFAFIFLIIGTFIFNYAKIVSFGDERKKIKLTKIKEALECEFLSDSGKEHLQDALATEHFSITTRIHAKKEVKVAIISAHKNFNGALRFVYFKRAVPYLRFENYELTINFTKFEKASFIYNILAASLCAFLGIFLFAITAFLNLEGSLAVFKHLGQSLIMCALGTFLFIETVPMFSAIHVREQLDKKSARPEF